MYWWAVFAFEPHFTGGCMEGPGGLHAAAWQGTEPQLLFAWGVNAGGKGGSWPQGEAPWVAAKVLGWWLVMFISRVRERGLLALSYLSEGCLLAGEGCVLG